MSLSFYKAIASLSITWCWWCHDINFSLFPSYQVFHASMCTHICGVFCLILQSLPCFLSFYCNFLKAALRDCQFYKNACPWPHAIYSRDLMFSKVGVLSPQCILQEMCKISSIIKFCMLNIELWAPNRILSVQLPR